MNIKQRMDGDTVATTGYDDKNNQSSGGTEKVGGKTEGDWVSLVQERITNATDWDMIRQMVAQVNYYKGNQWLYWVPSERRMRLAPVEDGQERITYNVIKPRVMVKLAKQTKNRIKFDVIPDSPSQERIEIARAAHKFLQYWWEEQELDRKTRDIFLNNNIKGWCAAKIFFDTSAGKDITPNEGDVGYEEGMQSIRTGEIKVRICDPLTIFIDNGATTDDEIRWIVERKPRDLDYIKETYNKEVKADDNTDYVQAYDLGSTTTGNSPTRNKNQAMVDEMWVKPCGKYPNGLKVTVAGGILLDIDDKAGDLPFFIFGDTPVPGSVKYEAFIKDMLPVQRQINIIKSSLVTHAKRMGNSLWLVPLGSSVDEDELTNETGGIIHYNGVNGLTPQRVSAPDIPGFYDRMLGNSMQDIDDMSGAREISQGRLPGGLDTLGGLELMVEQENEKLAVTSQNYERGMKNMLKRVIMLMKKHYTEERMAKVLGKDNEIEIVSFMGSDLSGGEDINIVQGSSLPEMRAATTDRVMTLWNSGAIVKQDGTPDHAKFVRLMGMGSDKALYEEKDLDTNKAKMENKIFEELSKDQNFVQSIAQYYEQLDQYEQFKQEAEAQGQDVSQLGLEQPQQPQGIPVTRTFFDNAEHIQIHNLFRKSQAYEDLDQNIQRLIDEHVEEHERLLRQPEEEAQAAEQQAIQQQQEQQMAADQQAQAQQQALSEQEIQVKQMDEQQQSVKNEMDMQKHNDNVSLQQQKLQIEALKAQIASLPRG